MFWEWLFISYATMYWWCFPWTDGNLSRRQHSGTESTWENRVLASWTFVPLACAVSLNWTNTGIPNPSNFSIFWNTRLEFMHMRNVLSMSIGPIDFSALRPSSMLILFSGFLEAALMNKNSTVSMTRPTMALHSTSDFVTLKLFLEPISLRHRRQLPRTITSISRLAITTETSWWRIARADQRSAPVLCRGRQECRFSLSQQPFCLSWIQQTFSLGHRHVQFFRFRIRLTNTDHSATTSDTQQRFLKREH